LPEDINAMGSVNTSHYTTGETVRKFCVDVTETVKSQSFEVRGEVFALNIGDSALPTTTQVDLNTSCGGLTVKKAKLFTPNNQGHPVLTPKNPGGHPGPYLSVALTAPIPTHTLPLTIDFEPKDADIKEVHISVSPGDTPAFSGDNLLLQAHTITNGQIRFSGIRLPAFPGAKTDGKVTVAVRLKGLVDGQQLMSEPDDDSKVEFKGRKAFVPLYLAGDQSGLGGDTRRYGARDVGGDSWATDKTIKFLQGRPYRFDDISGQHVAQFANGRSILDHTGHNNGQQMDLRYADGKGGFTDNLGGADTGTHIANLMSAARAEVESKAANKPNLALLQSWIKDNRAMIWAEVMAPDTHKVHIGLHFIRDALVYGRFPGQPALAIPGIDPVPLPLPSKLIPAGDHLHHWHVSKELVP